MPKPFASTAYCLAYFTYADRYVDFTYFNMPKDSQNICDELESTVPYMATKHKHYFGLTMDSAAAF